MHRQTKTIDSDLFAPGGSGSSGYGSDYSKAAYNSSSFTAATYPELTTQASAYGSDIYNNQHTSAPVSSQASLELEHVSGFTGKGRSTLHAHPTDAESYVTCMGAAVVIGNIHETHSQELLRGHGEEINAMSMSNAGVLLASAQVASRRHQEQGAMIIVWDLASRQELYRLGGFQKSVLQLAFSPDDHFLVASSEDCRVILWDMRTSELVLSKSFPTPVTILNWGKMEEKCRRPKYALTFAYGSQLQMGELAFDIAGMQYRLEVAPFAMPNVGLSRNYLCAAMTSSKTDLLAGTIAGELVVFNTDAQNYRNAVPVAHNGVHSLVACRTTGYVYVGAGDGVLKKLLGRDSDWNLVGQVQLVGGVTSLSVSPDGTQLFAGTSAGKMYHLHSNTLAPTEFASSHLGAVTACGFVESSSSSTGSSSTDTIEDFATISLDGSVRVWSLSSYTLKCMATETVGGLSLAITKPTTAHTNAKQPVIVSGWADGWLRAYDAATAHKKWHIANAHRGKVTSVATSALYIVSGSSDGGVSVWSSQTHELVLQFHEHARGVSQVLVDVGKPHIVHSCGLDKAIFLYDLKAERRIMAQHVKDGAFHGITQRLDSETELISAGADGRLFFWDCDIVEPVQCLDAGSRHVRVCAVAVSPSGCYVAACDDDGAVQIFDLRTMALLIPATRGHSDAVNNLSWSPDERQLVSVGDDSCVCVWNFYTE